MIGGLYAYLREADPERFQPMNANFGLVPPADRRLRGKRERRAAQSARALSAIEAWAEAREPAGARVGAR
jgi:methylenetetrahydrofolate--tRNA-(uracil-5-)-methyltransferase